MISRFASLAVIVAVIIAMVACSSPDTCDQNVIAGISKFCEDLVSVPVGSSGGNRWQLVGPFSCAAGGSGSANVSGDQSFWNGSMTFDNCTISVNRGFVAVSGYVVLMGDLVNGPLNWATAGTLMIQGSAATCAPIDETCPVIWTPHLEDGENFSIEGTLCGRHFP